jgi:hypothetical protein
VYHPRCEQLTKRDFPKLRMQTLPFKIAFRQIHIHQGSDVFSPKVTEDLQ